MKIRWPKGVLVHAVRHPMDGIALLRAGWGLRRSDWWRSSPFLPVPDPEYWTFRMVTAYGSSESVASVEDAVAAAKWSVRVRRGR